ncbi:hypothetical protein M5689_019855 [Euphorbia peplus]|nr:hypothetical protein M5689_019855 [Euphorbia peplus]
MNTREDELAVKIDDMIGDGGEFGEDIGRLTNCFDFIAIDDDSAGFENSGAGVHSDNCSIVDDRHGGFSRRRLHCFALSSSSLLLPASKFDFHLTQTLTILPPTPTAPF